MRTCPCCRQDALLQLVDGPSGFREAVCPSCGYYESDSPAYTTIPEMFRDLGFEVLRRLERQIGAYGLTGCEARAWFSQEPTFNKAIVNRHESPSTPNLKSPRDKLTPYPPGGPPVQYVESSQASWATPSSTSQI